MSSINASLGFHGGICQEVCNINSLSLLLLEIESFLFEKLL